MSFKKISFKKFLITLVIFFIAIQAIRINKINPQTDPSKDFMNVTNPPAEIAAILNSSCYDCHSNTTIYPWYTNISPISWWIKHHVNEGRQKLNFSEWANYPSPKKDHKLKEAIEQVEENEMPMGSYLWTHKNAKLNEEQKTKLNAFFNSLHTHEN